MKVPVGPKGAAGPMKETNNHMQGRSGARVPVKAGPANKGVLAGNPTSGGGINRPTKGRG